MVCIFGRKRFRSRKLNSNIGSYCVARSDIFQTWHNSNSMTRILNVLFQMEFTNCRIWSILAVVVNRLYHTRLIQKQVGRASVWFSSPDKCLVKCVSPKHFVHTFPPPIFQLYSIEWRNWAGACVNFSGLWELFFYMLLTRGT